jgi:hypothetical protein
MGKVKRVHALTNTASGAAGEARVAAELTRCGIQAAKPYWNDDEVDLLVLWRDGDTLFPVPIQVKSVQRLQDKGGNDFISGLKKRYVEGLPTLCLAIYHPKTDRIWFIDTAARIKQVYAEQGGWHKHVSYEELACGDDVRIGLSLLEQTSRLDAEWLVPRDDASWLSNRIVRATQPTRDAKVLETVIQHMFEMHEQSGNEEQIGGACETKGEETPEHPKVAGNMPEEGKAKP